jgi:hypothetical protein
MAILVSILIIYGLLATYYFIFKHLPTILLYVLMSPIVVVSPFIIAHKQLKTNHKFIGYTLYTLFGLLYLFFIALMIF